LVDLAEKGYIRIWGHGNFSYSIYFRASEARIKDLKRV
jgi:hypothetical protein